MTLGFLVRPMRLEDIEAAQRAGQEAWSDLASKELGRNVRYPLRPRRIIESYLQQEPGGCFVAERQGEVVGAAYTHAWGGIGWFGPFEVLPTMQGKGVGRALLGECERHLLQRGCRTIGLETMANIVRNINFYLRNGYRAAGASLIMEKVLRAEDEAGAMETSTVEEALGAKADLAAMSSACLPGADYSGEAMAAAQGGLGPVFLLRRRGHVRAAAVLHSYYPPQDADHVAMRLLMAHPRSRMQDGLFDEAMGACEAWAFSHGRKRIFVRFSGDRELMYSRLISRGYRLDAANMRMTRGAPLRERAAYHMAAWAG